MSENSYFRDISGQVSEIVFLAHLTVYGFLQLYELKYQKTYDSASSIHKYNKSFSKPNWPFYGFSQLYELKGQNLITPRVKCTSITNGVLSWFYRCTAY